jgi:MFS family permease
LKESGARQGGALRVYAAKGARVYVSGLLSVLLPAYLRLLGYSPLFVAEALTAILAGNAVSNILLTYYDRTLGRRRLLLAFSAMMVASGFVFAFVDSAIPILVACLLGNISTTGTEAGPFQSVEAGVLPELVGRDRTVRAFGTYNLVGYTASALGAFTLYIPGSEGNNGAVFQALFLVFAGVGVLLFFLYGRLQGVEVTGARVSNGLSEMGPQAREDVTRLSALYSIDAFGGSFVSQYLLSYWFTLSFGVPNTSLAVIFLVTNVISAASTYGASFLAERLGNLRTMVYTHVVSNAFLLMVALSGTLSAAVAFLFLRQAFSQMDVPSRQALMAEMFGREDRVPAYAITNTVRSGGSLLGGPAVAAILAAGIPAGLIYTGGLSKLAYDALVFLRYRSRYR